MVLTLGGTLVGLLQFDVLATRGEKMSIRLCLECGAVWCGADRERTSFWRNGECWFDLSVDEVCCVHDCFPLTASEVVFDKVCSGCHGAGRYMLHRSSGWMPRHRFVRTLHAPPVAPDAACSCIRRRYGVACPRLPARRRCTCGVLCRQAPPL